MKQFFAIAFAAAFVVSCAKKETEYEQDSSTMLEEPKMEVTDSAVVTQPTDQTTVAAPDSVRTVTIDTVTVN